MAAIKLEKFQGMIPRSSDRLLPNMSATAARNTKLLNGEIRGYRAFREAANFTAESVSPVRRAFRVRDPAGGYQDDWLIFDSRDVDVVRSPLINDTFDRYYIAGEGRPKMTTFERIAEGDPPLFLGIPAPGAAPNVTPPAGDDETRAYVYTFVSAYGEEGAPSPPTLATGDAGTWSLTGIQGSVDNPSNRNVTKVRIYRTVSGGNSSNFYFVAEIDLGTTTYNDNQSTTTVAANNLLESTSFIEPPTDLEGFVVMPNGYLVGWVGRRLLFSEPYRPHAWPAEYELSTEFPIVGLVVWGATVVIGTQSQPYFGQGNTPAAFTTRKLDAVEPCLSRRGMVATTAGAYYPSINGLVLADASGARVITQDVLTKEEWEAYNPGDIYAAQLGLQYIAFNTTSGGFVFNPTEPDTKLVELEGFAGVEGIETDKYSGNVLLLAQNRAWDWDPANAERLSWRWQSKIFQTPEPVNFGAARLMFKTGTEDISLDIDGYYGSYGDDLFAAVPSGDAPVASDPLYAQVALLAEFNGADGATAYTELSQSAVACTFLGTAQLDTAQKNLGSASLLLDGDSDSVQLNAGEVDFGGDDWTIEAFVRFNALPGVGEIQAIYSDWFGANESVAMTIAQDVFGYRIRGYFDGTFEHATITPVVDTWYHVAMVRDGSNMHLYFNGVRQFSAAVILSDIPASSTVRRIGASGNDEWYFNGWIDGVRVTVGTARYTGATLTVPSTEYPLLGTSGIEQRGLNTLNGHVLGGSPAQAKGLVSGWTEPENRQPLGGSLLYPISTLSFQTLAVRLQIKVDGGETIKFDKVIFNEQIFRLPTGYKSDLWQFNLLGNTDVYSLQVGTTPRALKQV